MNRQNKGKGKQPARKRRDLSVSAKGNAKILGMGSGSGEVAVVYKRAPLAAAKRTVARRPRTNGSRSFTVAHTEYLADLSAVSPGFSVVSYPINPALASTFPWLASLAGNFDQYRIKRLAVRFESSAPATENGRVFLAFDYDPQDDVPNDKGSFMSYRGATSDAVWTSNQCMFTGPRLSRTYYTRSGQVVGDVRLYDAGNLLVSTSGVSNGLLCGELYLDYEMELMNPQGSSACSPETYMAAELTSATPALGLNPLSNASSNNPSGVSIVSGSSFSIHTPGNYILSTYAPVTAGTPGSGTYWNLSVGSGTASVGGIGYGWNTTVPGLTQTFRIDQSSTDATYNISNAVSNSITTVFTAEICPASH